MFFLFCSTTCASEVVIPLWVVVGKHCQPLSTFRFPARQWTLFGLLCLPVAAAWCLFSPGLKQIAPAGAHCPGWPRLVPHWMITGHCWGRTIIRPQGRFVFRSLLTFLRSTLSFLFTKDLRLWVTVTLSFCECVSVCVWEWISPLLCLLSVMALGGIFLYSIFSSHTLKCVPSRGNCFR